MAKTIQTNGDLTIKTRLQVSDPAIGSDIILDPSPNSVVRITGPLVVEGEEVIGKKTALAYSMIF